MPLGKYVNTNLEGKPSSFYSRFFDKMAKGTDLFKQQLHLCQEMFCFPPPPMIYKVEKYKLASFRLAEPYNSTCFTITHATGKRVPKRYNHPMQAVFLSFG